MKAATLSTAVFAAIGGTAAVAIPSNGTALVTVPITGAHPLRDLAAKKGILIGSGATRPVYLNDTQFATVLAREFNSFSPDNELKWTELEPTEGDYNWDSLDALVDFAEANNMAVKGHGLISGCCTPDYVLNITAPPALRAALAAHFDAVMHRYAGRMDRWDVVTEALLTMGGGLAHNNFYNICGPGYIDEAFYIARAAAPRAKLFINENLVESYPDKRQELYDLVSRLVKKGVPIDGVALEMHVVEGIQPEPGVVTEIIHSYHALGLEVSISEMDVSTLNVTLQTELYGSIISEALEAGVTDISFWGFTDKHEYPYIPGAHPLMFTANYTAKGAYYATNIALSDFVDGCQLVSRTIKP